MAFTNAILPFGLGVGSNVMSAAAWASVAARTAGFQQGLASSQQVNTAIRQTAFVSTMIAQFTADWGIANVVDDGNIPNFEANFEAALAAYFSSIFSNQWWSGPDTGANGATLVLTPTQTFTAYAAYQGFIFKLAHNITGGATLNVAGKGPKAIVYEDGTPVATNDFVAGGIMTLIYDGTKMQIVGALPLGSLGIPRNAQQFSSSTRVVMVGNAGNSYTVSPWSPGNYNKISATSDIWVWAMLPTFTPNSPGQGGGTVTLKVGGVGPSMISANNQSSQFVGMNVILYRLTGVGAGAQAITLNWSRPDATAWQTSFVPSATDFASIPAGLVASILIMEVGV